MPCKVMPCKALVASQGPLPKMRLRPQGPHKNRIRGTFPQITGMGSSYRTSYGRGGRTMPRSQRSAPWNADRLRENQNVLQPPFTENRDAFTLDFHRRYRHSLPLPIQGHHIISLCSSAHQSVLLEVPFHTTQWSPSQMSNPRIPASPPLFLRVLSPSSSVPPAVSAKRRSSDSRSIPVNPASILSAARRKPEIALQPNAGRLTRRGTTYSSKQTRA